MKNISMAHACNRLTWTSLAVIVFSGISFSQQSTNVSASTIQQIQERMRENGIREPDSLLKSAGISEGSIGEIKSKMLTDTTLGHLSDTSDTSKRNLSLQEEVKDTSIYERIVRGESINPDSLLHNIDIFGLSVFQQKQGSAAQGSVQVSVPAGYLIGPGDELDIMLWGRINEEDRLTVARDGSINLPHVGPVSVAGLPFSVMQETINKRLQAIEGVQASVTMGQLRSIPVFVVGEVVKPGQYTLSALSDITSALFAAGGVSKKGSLRNIELRRNGALIASLDFYDFLLAGNNFGNIRLSAGDVVFVPIVTSMAAVAGNVRRSALYELKGKTTLKDLIDLAGGFSPAAWINRIQVERFQNKQSQIILDVQAGPDAKLPDLLIEDGDIVRVFQVLVRDKNAVYLAGNVLRPGKYELKEEMRVSDVVNGFDALLPETYFEYAVIHRLEPPQYTEQIISFDLRNALETPGCPDDIELRPYDNVIVYSRDFFEPDRNVSIDGAITSPGRFRLLDNMRIKDLVLQAGGLTDAASSDRGELYRRSVVGDTVRTAKIPFCVSCAMQDDPQNNLTLSKLDNVFIRQKRGWEDTRTITLLGEFVFPGQYVLLQNETLGQLIRRAGGFSSHAYLDAAVFMRQSVKAMEKKRNDDYMRSLEADIARLSAELAAKDNLAEAQAILNIQVQLINQMKDLQPIGRVVVDLNRSETYENFTLENGDSLVVPKQLNTVSVFGEVFNPMTFQHDPADPVVNNYLHQAGGMKENADRRNVYVIKASGSVVSGGRSYIKHYDLQPGDAVIVPQRIRFVSGYNVMMQTIDAVYKVAMTAAVVFTLLKQ